MPGTADQRLTERSLTVCATVRIPIHICTRNGARRRETIVKKFKEFLEKHP
jgi:hypothetical protein